MLTGEIRSKIDALWNAFWSGGIANPLEVIEQITYLLFLKRLDDLHTLEENKSTRLKKPMERRVFPEGKDPKKRPYEDCRWSRFKHFEAKEMFEVVDQHVFPFLRTLGGDDSTYAHHMKDARFTIPTPALLAKVVDMIDGVPMEERDTKGDLYEYMLGKIASAGQNGQFRTPRHIIQLMVELTAPTAKDVICDPACGTGGFLVAAGEYLRDHHPEILRDRSLKKHFHEQAFHGFDFDNTMLRIGSMNMLLHGVENPAIRYRDSLAQDHAGEEEKYTLVLANPPFAGSLDYENCAKDLQQIVKTKKTELLFLALFLRLLKPGGRAAVIVPDGVLFGSSNAHKTLRQMLVEEQKLDAVISLPGGVFKPYAGVSTAILLFTKTNSGGTDHVWFYDVDADGMSLDDKRTELLPSEKLGPVPKVALTAADHAKNNLPDILARWRSFGAPMFGVPASAGKAPESQRASKFSKSADKSHTPPAKAGTPNRYVWRQLTPKQREEVLAWRKENKRPWHSPPHRPNYGHLHFLVSAACYEHAHFIGHSPQRMDTFSAALLELFQKHTTRTVAWCVLPNHYHALVAAPNILKLLHELGRFHGRTSHAWNGEENTRGRQVFHRAVERFMRSERHFFATINYLHNNPVHHGYVRLWTEWPWSSAVEYLEQTGRAEAERVWQDYPIRDYGKKWDDADV